MYIEHNVVAHSCNHFCSGKAINIAYSENVFVALGIQRLTLQYFSALFHERQIWGWGVELLDIKCVY